MYFNHFSNFRSERFSYRHIFSALRSKCGERPCTCAPRAPHIFIKILIQIVFFFCEIVFHLPGTEYRKELVTSSRYVTRSQVDTWTD